MGKPQADQMSLVETCLYCQRVRWGEFQYLGNGQWRHAECFPGSEGWQEHYHRTPKAKRTSAMDLLFQHYRKGETT